MHQDYLKCLQRLLGRQLHRRHCSLGCQILLQYLDYRQRRLHRLYQQLRYYQGCLSFLLFLSFRRIPLPRLLHYRQRLRYHLHRLGMLIDFQMRKHFLLYLQHQLCRLLHLFLQYLQLQLPRGYQLHLV